MTQTVWLQGGSGDGRLAEAEPAPRTLRLGFQRDDQRWSELYMYDGSTFEHPEHGTLPVMLFTSRDEEA